MLEGVERLQGRHAGQTPHSASRAHPPGAVLGTAQASSPWPREVGTRHRRGTGTGRSRDSDSGQAALRAANPRARVSFPKWNHTGFEICLLVRGPCWLLSLGSAATEGVASELAPGLPATDLRPLGSHGSCCSASSQGRGEWGISLLGLQSHSPTTQGLRAPPPVTSLYYDPLG